MDTPELLLVLVSLFVTFGLGGIAGFFFSLRVISARLKPLTDLGNKLMGGGPAGAPRGPTNMWGVIGSVIGQPGVVQALLGKFLGKEP